MARRKKSKEDFKKGFETEDKDIQSTKRRTKSSRSDKSGSTRDWICSEGKPTNDPAWYVNNPVLSRDVGNIFFSRPTGDPLALSVIAPNATTRFDIYDPGILAYPSIITWGGMPDSPVGAGQAPINLVAQKLYQFVVHANSRNTSYDKKDLMLSMMSIDAIYCVITEAIRAYRLIANYDPQNRYVSNLLTAMHWDAADLKSKVSAFRYHINWAISRINKFFMPSLFDMTKAHTACYENIYMDRPDMKGQFIVKYSAGIWMYDDTLGSLTYLSKFTYMNSAGGTPVDWSGYHTVEDFRQAIETMIYQVENSQYMGVMQGDLLKAFGFENMSNYAYVGIDMPISPVYDEEFNFKLHNADVSHYLSDVFHYSYNSISSCAAMVYRDTNQVDGNILCLFYPFTGRVSGTDSSALQTTFNSFRQANGALVDLPSGVVPSPENVLLMSLYKVFPARLTSGHFQLNDTVDDDVAYGPLNPEILLKGDIYYDPSNPIRSEGTSTYRYNLRVISLLSRFATAPLITQRGDAITDTEPIFWETNNVANVSSDLLVRMNEVVIWSLWSNARISSRDTMSRDTRV